jgi:hypothetical protein
VLEPNPPKIKEKVMHRGIPGMPVLLDCPSCHSFIGANDIVLDQKEATCSHCGHHFSFADSIKRDPHRRPEIFMPDGVEALKIRSMLDIVVDWYKSAPKRAIGSLVLSSFIWNIILIPLVVFFLFSGDFIFILFFSGHVFTGLALIAYLLTMFVNKTHIMVTEKGIDIQHKPFKRIFNKPRKIARDDIKQLYVSRYIQKFGKKNKKGVEAYALYAILKNNKSVELIKGLNRETQMYLEQEIETYLKIKDLPIKGEIPRD